MMKQFGKESESKRRLKGSDLYESEIYELSLNDDPKPVVLGKENLNLFVMSDLNGTHFWDLRAQQKLWTTNHTNVSQRGLDIGDFILNIAEKHKPNSLLL